MVTKHNLDCFDPFTARFIRAKVRKLIGLAGFTESDRLDLTQEFVRDILQRRKKFKPANGNWEAFVVVVCENRFATILEHRQAAMRSCHCEAGSLNCPVKHAKGKRVEIGDIIPQPEQDPRTGRRHPSHEKTADMAMDISEVLQHLPPEEREICERLKHGSKRSVACSLGMSQGAFYGVLKQIRSRFERASLRDYLN